MSDGSGGGLRRLAALAISLLAAGIWAAATLPVEWFPAPQAPTVTVSAPWPAGSAREVERRVTSPLERALQRIPGTARVSSVSTAAGATLDLVTDPRRPRAAYLVEVGHRLQAARRELPAGVHPRLATTPAQALRPDVVFLRLELSGSAGAAVLGRVAREAIAPALASLPPVAEVEVLGEARPELRIELDAPALHAHDLRLDDLRQRLAAAARPQSYGWSRGSVQGLWLRAPTSEPQALSRLPVSDPGRPLLRLSDIAHVETISRPAPQRSRVDGQEAVLIVVHRRPGTHLLAASRQVRERLTDLTPRLPPGVHLTIVDDRADDLRWELRDLALRGGLGALLLVALLAIIFRRPRATAIVLSVVVLSLAAALLLMRLLGLSINLLTLGGLALLVGLLVDNAVVAVERVVARRARGTGLSRAADRRAVLEVAKPLLGGVVTTVAVLLPLAWLDDDFRAPFVAFAALAATSLTLSLVLAVLVVPELGAALPAATRRRRGRSVRRVTAVYAWALRRPGWILLALLLLLGLPTPLLPVAIDEPDDGWASVEDERRAHLYNASLGSQAAQRLRRSLDPFIAGATGRFVADVDFGRRWDFASRPELHVAISTAVGIDASRIDHLLQRFETLATGSPAVVRTLARSSPGRAEMTAILSRHPDTSAAALALRRGLIAAAQQMAGVEVSIWGLVPASFHNGRGEATGFTLEARGAQLDRLEALGTELARRLERDPRVAGVDLDADAAFRGKQQVLSIDWTGETARRTGVSAGELVSRLEPWVERPSPDLQLRDGEGAPLPVRFASLGSAPTGLADLLAGILPGRRQVRVGDATAVSIKERGGSILRTDQQYRRYLRVHYQGPYKLGRERIDRCLAALPLPAGYSIERLDAASLERPDDRRLVAAMFAGGAMVVLLTLVILFESWRHALLAALALPAAGVGVALALWASGGPIAEGAVLGALLILGVAVNDSILLVERYAALVRRRGRALRPRLALLALRQRLRPMWTTTATSAAAVAPLLLPGAGAFWRDYSLAVVGGLLAATLLAPAAILAMIALAHRYPAACNSNSSA